MALAARWLSLGGICFEASDDRETDVDRGTGPRFDRRGGSGCAGGADCESRAAGEPERDGGGISAAGSGTFPGRYFCFFQSIGRPESDRPGLAD